MERTMLLLVDSLENKVHRDDDTGVCRAVPRVCVYMKSLCCGRGQRPRGVHFRTSLTKLDIFIEYESPVAIFTIDNTSIGA